MFVALLKKLLRPGKPSPSTSQELAAFKIAPGFRRWSALLGISLLGFSVVVGAVYYAESQPRDPKLDGASRSLLQRVAPEAFDLSNLQIPRQSLKRGGPPKDGIPALTNPEITQANETSYLQPDDRVIGVIRSGRARAYPLRILNYHEIVNDQLGGDLFAVTYCPLCDSAVVFDRDTPVGKREFGVSGLLYNSNVLMYDRSNNVDSLWSQLQISGISGPGAGRQLTTLPLELTTWRKWSSRYPQTTVLSERTGHVRDYTRNPYQRYFQSSRLMFPAEPRNDRLPIKEPVLGAWFADAVVAFPRSAFTGDQQRLTAILDGKQITVEFDPGSQTLRVADADDGIQWSYALWFAWYAFHPETLVVSGANQNP